MTPQEAIPILERLQEPEAWEPQISRDAYEALEMAIEALERVSLLKQEKSNSFSKELSEDGESEMNSSDEWWKNYIRSRMSRDDGTYNNVDKSDWSE